MTQKIYLEDPYKKEETAKVVNITIKGDQAKIILDKTIFYPQGGGQPADKGRIVGPNGNAIVHQVQTEKGEIVHLSSLQGIFKDGEEVRLFLDWDRRYLNMRYQSAGHVLHEAIIQVIPNPSPVGAEHNPQNAYLVYRGTITQDKKSEIETMANQIVSAQKQIKQRVVDLAELEREAQFVPKNLPRESELRITTIEGYKPIPCGATHVQNTGEIQNINLTYIKEENGITKVGYSLQPVKQQEKNQGLDALAVKMIKREKVENDFSQTAQIDKDSLFRLKNDSIAKIIESQSIKSLTDAKVRIFGKNGDFTILTKKLASLSPDQRRELGKLANEVRTAIENAILEKENHLAKTERQETIDVTEPGIPPQVGHLHLVTQTINEIEDIFSRIGFTRRRYPEVTTDWYNFEGLNVPQDHPTRDEQETFFLTNGLVLSTHTSSGQLKEMERRKPPIRMINIAKCYRRQADTRHLWMFHQFEGLVIDKNINITHLKGTIHFFTKNFYGQNSSYRIRPYHFRYTEPSFEVDFECSLCQGKGCQICKDGWLEVGGAGMVNPNVLKNGGLDPKVYSGFAFGWGVERTAMNRPGINFNDTRTFYEPDLRILEQF